MKKNLLITALLLTTTAQAQGQGNDLLNKISGGVGNFLNNIIQQNTPAKQSAPNVSSDVSKMVYIKAGQSVTLMTNATDKEATAADVTPEGWTVKVDSRMGSNTLITFTAPENAAVNDYACANSPVKVGLKTFARRVCVFVSDKDKDTKHEGIAEIKF